MLKTALYVRLEAKPGKEDEVEAFLKGGLPIVMEEPATVAWFGRLAYVLDLQHLVFLMHFLMRRVAKHIYLARLQLL